MIIQGDCLEVMRSMDDNSISAVVTDPPYGLHFMGKGWDHAVPGKEYWEECKRLLKPGGFLLAMGGTRTFHRLTCAIEDAGLEIRDCVSWLYGSGFPKSHNHFGIDGYGTALKPAWEPIVMAMKPCVGTFKQNAEKWGQAGLNIDGCRIGNESRFNSGAKNSDPKLWRMNQGINGKECIGRWPANLILDEEAAQLLDEQSGISKSNSNPRPKGKSVHCYGQFNEFKSDASHLNDSGGASRFFYCAKASPSERNEGLQEMPIINAPKLGEYANNPGREAPKSSYGKQNYHPTVKPLKLMEYLIKLVMPPKDGILLDPFAGSGTTILAAKRLGFDAIGIEKDAEYCKIAKARIDNFKEKDIIKENQQFELFAQVG